MPRSVGGMSEEKSSMKLGLTMLVTIKGIAFGGVR